MLECVPNVAEGRDLDVLDALADACRPALLDRHVDPDHHRSVFTLAGSATSPAARRLADEAAARLDLRTHRGVHPRLGALDVVPFVALEGPPEQAVGAAHEFGTWIAAAHHLPVFFYGAADPHARSLPDLRRDAFARRPPDVGPPEPHPRLGAVAVGARPPLVAVNCWLADGDLALARSVAAAVRERDGGLPGVRALGFALASRHLAQVSMNLVALERTGVEAACTAVRRHVEALGARLSRVELVGLLPAAELARCTPEFVAWAGLTPDDTIEARLARGRDGSTPT